MRVILNEVKNLRDFARSNKILFGLRPQILHFVQNDTISYFELA